MKLLRSIFAAGRRRCGQILGLTNVSSIGLSLRERPACLPSARTSNFLPRAAIPLYAKGHLVVINYPGVYATEPTPTKRPPI